MNENEYLFTVKFYAKNVNYHLSYEVSNMPPRINVLLLIGVDFNNCKKYYVRLNNFKQLILDRVDIKHIYFIRFYINIRRPHKYIREQIQSVRSGNLLRIRPCDRM